MKNEDFIENKRIIRHIFKDERKIKCVACEDEIKLDDDIHPGGDVFKTEEGEYIDLEFQLEDFDENELAKYVDFAERLYEKHHKHVSVYLLCPDTINVSVRELNIKSDADFTIRLAHDGRDRCEMILERIKNKASSGEVLSCEDIDALEMLPLMCERSKRRYYRAECFKILNRIPY
jgi:hypothetical protein